MITGCVDPTQKKRGRMRVTRPRCSQVKRKRERRENAPALPPMDASGGRPRRANRPGTEILRAGRKGRRVCRLRACGRARLHYTSQEVPAVVASRPRTNPDHTTTMLSRVAAPLRQSLRLSRTYATTPALTAVRKPPSTSSADLHELPQSVKSAARPSSSASASPSKTDASGNSTAPEDISSRPAGPGPSGPIVDPSVAAPETVSRGRNGGGAAAGDAAQENWTTSFAGMSERPFDGKAADVLSQELDPEDVEIKPGELPS